MFGGTKGDEAKADPCGCKLRQDFGSGGTAGIKPVGWGDLQGDVKAGDGAGQVLIRNARLSKNSLAIQSEGRAEVHAEGNTIDGNQVAFRGYAGAGGDRLHIYPNRLTDNQVEREGAGFKERTALDESTVSVFGVPLQMPTVEEGRGSGRSRRSRTND